MDPLLIQADQDGGRKLGGDEEDPSGHDDEVFHQGKEAQALGRHLINGEMNITLDHALEE